MSLNSIVCIDSNGTRYAVLLCKNKREADIIMEKIENFGLRMFQKAKKPITINIIEEDLTGAVWSE